MKPRFLVIVFAISLVFATIVKSQDSPTKGRSDGGIPNSMKSGMSIGMSGMGNAGQCGIIMPNLSVFLQSMLSNLPEDLRKDLSRPVRKFTKAADKLKSASEEICKKITTWKLNIEKGVTVERKQENGDEVSPACGFCSRAFSYFLKLGQKLSKNPAAMAGPKLKDLLTKVRRDMNRMCKNKQTGKPENCKEGVRNFMKIMQGQANGQTSNVMKDFCPALVGVQCKLKLPF